MPVADGDRHSAVAFGIEVEAGGALCETGEKVSIVEPDDVIELNVSEAGSLTLDDQVGVDGEVAANRR